MEFPIPEAIYSWQFWCSAVLCYVVCEAIKRIPNIPDWTINLVNLAAGAILYTILTGGWTEPASYLFGILAASVADIAFQIYKNVIHAISAPMTKTTGGE